MKNAAKTKIPSEPSVKRVLKNRLCVCLGPGSTCSVKLQSSFPLYLPKASRALRGPVPVIGCFRKPQMEPRHCSNLCPVLLLLLPFVMKAEALLGIDAMRSFRACPDGVLSMNMERIRVPPTITHETFDFRFVIKNIIMPTANKNRAVRVPVKYVLMIPSMIHAPMVRGSAALFNVSLDIFFVEINT